MSRNKNRVPVPVPAVEEQQNQATNNVFNFIVPTEMVDLPSKGEFYPEGHPLHGVDSIEIKHMTAKEEDILTSQTLIKKGIAVNKVLESIIVDKRIKVEDLLIGDKNALIIASRIYGYGPEYKVNLNCGNCGNNFETSVDLNNFSIKDIKVKESVEISENNTFIFNLPQSEFVVEE